MRGGTANGVRIESLWERTGGAEVRIKVRCMRRFVRIKIDALPG